MLIHTHTQKKTLKCPITYPPELLVLAISQVESSIKSNANYTKQKENNKHCSQVLNATSKKI